MVTAILFPDEYSYVFVPVIASAVINFWHTMRTGAKRGKAKIPYPNAYATAEESAKSREKYLFNCAQRAHAHYHEHLTPFLASLLISGLRYPVASAALGTAWVVARAHYMFAYTRESNNENGSGRLIASWWYFPYMGLIGTAIFTTFKLVTS